jgi:hypothetical protein
MKLVVSYRKGSLLPCCYPIRAELVNRFRPSRTLFLQNSLFSAKNLLTLTKIGIISAAT